MWTAIIGAALQLGIQIIGIVMPRFKASEEMKRSFLEFVKYTEENRAALAAGRDSAKSQDKELDDYLKQPPK